MTGLGLNSPFVTESERYEGVAGWLLLFCIDLIVIVPGSHLYRVFGHTIPMLLRTHEPKRQILWTVFVVIYIAIAAVAFVTGLRLWLVRRGAVRMARLWLLMMLSTHVAYFFLWLVLFLHERTEPVAKVAWNHIIAPLIPFCIWNAYLARSKRVRDTYQQVDQVRTPLGAGTPACLCE